VCKFHRVSGGVGPYGQGDLLVFAGLSETCLSVWACGRFKSQLLGDGGTCLDAGDIGKKCLSSGELYEKKRRFLALFVDRARSHAQVVFVVRCAKERPSNHSVFPI
jgi:hypothetical protein